MYKQTISDFLKRNFGFLKYFFSYSIVSRIINHLKIYKKNSIDYKN